MSERAIDIERVVREVLAELGGARENRNECPATGGNSSFQRPATAVAGGADGDAIAPPGPQSRGVDSNNNDLVVNGNDLVVTSRVVTMLELSGRLDAARRVLVSREAVVTPAVRDELLRRGIALAYAPSANGHPAPVRLTMIATGTDFDPAALVAGLAREGLKVESLACDCLIKATDQLATEVAQPDTLGVLLTRHTAAGMCLANRLDGVRAVTGVDAPAVAAAAAAVGANLLVADPRAGTFFQLKQMVTEFCRGGVRPCPAVFRERLT
jgi:hypothetical protein